MSDLLLKRYNLLPKEFQSEVQNYIEYLLLKSKKNNKSCSEKNGRKEKIVAYENLLNYTGCIPSDIDYKKEYKEAALKKYVSPETLRDIFYNLFEIIEIGRADKNSVLEALKNTEFTDFEDGLQYQCALEEFVDCIITRNKKDFFSSKIPVYTPSEFLKSL